MSIEIILSEAGKTLGIADLSFDHRGFCSLTIEDDYQVMLSLDLEQNRVNLCARVLIMPDSYEAREEIFKYLLNAQTMGQASFGCHFSYDYQSEQIAQLISINTDRLTGDDLVTQLERFVNAMKYWRDKLPQLIMDIPEPSHEADSTTSFNFQAFRA